MNNHLSFLVIHHKGTLAVIIDLFRTDKALLDEMLIVRIATDVLAERPIEIGLILAETEIIASSRSIQTTNDVIGYVRAATLDGLMFLNDQLNGSAWAHLDVVMLRSRKPLREHVGISVIIDTKTSIFDYNGFNTVVIGVRVPMKIDWTINFDHRARIGARTIEPPKDTRTLHSLPLS